MWQKTVDYLVFGLMGLGPESSAGEVVNYFIYDTVKILVLLAGIIFVVALLRSWFPAEKTRRILSHRRHYLGNLVAALMGIVTPF